MTWPSSVSLSSDGTIFAAGAAYNDGTARPRGHARVYQFSSGSWTQLGSDIDGEAADDNSGWSVSLSSDGTILAVGARWQRRHGLQCGPCARPSVVRRFVDSVGR